SRPTLTCGMSRCSTRASSSNSRRPWLSQATTSRMSSRRSGSPRRSSRRAATRTPSAQICWLRWTALPPASPRDPQMTELQELKGRLDLLPEKHRLKAIVGRLTEFRDLLSESASAFDAALAQEAAVRRVFGAEATTSASDERKRAGKVAKRMAAKVRARLDA